MPRIKLTHDRANALLAKANYEMACERQKALRELLRGARYEWEYRDGKKTAVKAGVGLSIGMGFVIIGGATHGVGVPVVIGLAVAGLVVGKLNDVAFAKFWGRDKTGGKRTWRWKGGYESPNTFGETQELEERAHKTLRRASQHYLSAWTKAQPLRSTVKPLLGFSTCDEVHERLKAMLPILRPFEKAWLYIQPAIYLSQALLEFSEGFQNGCAIELAKVRNRLWHDDVACGSQDCFQTKIIAAVNNRFGIPLWQERDYDEMKEKLREAKETIDHCIDVEVVDPEDPFNFRGPWTVRMNDAVKLYDRAAAKYNVRSASTKVWHGITNSWHRKTKSEKEAFVGKHFASVFFTASGVGLGAAFDGFAPLIDIGEHFVEEAFAELPLGEGADGDRDVDDETLEKRQAEIAAAMQDGLRGAALHLCEVFRIAAAIEQPEEFYRTCDEAVEYYIKICKINHHLSKAQEYLGPTIVKAAKLSQRIGNDCATLREYNNWVRKTAVSFLDHRNHNNCSAGKCINFL